MEYLKNDSILKFKTNLANTNNLDTRTLILFKEKGPCSIFSVYSSILQLPFCERLTFIFIDERKGFVAFSVIDYL